MSLHRACCCVDLTCGLDALSICNFSSVAACGRFSICVSGETGDLAGLNTDPGKLMTRYAAGQYRYEEATVRKYELDIIEPTAPNAGNDYPTFEIRAYLWDTGAWSLERTITGTASGDMGGVPDSTVYQVRALDPWYPETISVSFTGVSLCNDPLVPDDEECYTYTDGVDTWGAKVTAFSVTGGTLTRQASYDAPCPTFTPSFLCSYGYAAVGYVTFKRYVNPTDCIFDPDNFLDEITINVICKVCFASGRRVFIYTYAPGFIAVETEIFQANEDFANDWVSTGDSQAVSNGNPVPGPGDICEYPSSGGTCTITIPSFGS